MKIGYVGLGKLGLPVALIAAKKGHDVVGTDINPAVEQMIATGTFPHREADIENYLPGTTLRFVHSTADVVAHADLVFCAVQTPHNPRFGGDIPIPEERVDFDYTHIVNAVREISNEAVRQQKPIVLAVISTMLPGTTVREILPVINSQFVQFCYTPQFIAMSTVIHDYLYPEFVLLGTTNDTLGNAERMVRDFFATITDAEVVSMDVTSAEAAKVFYNTTISTKVTLANTIMEACERVGADCDKVTGALNKATRRLVSSAYTRGGMGDGGGCFVEGQLIHVEDGVRAIDEIEIGEKVLGGDGLLHEVLETYKRPYKGPIHAIKVRGLQPFQVTSDHPVHVARDLRTKYANGKRDQTKGPQLGPIQEVRAGDLTDDFYVVFPTPKAQSEREAQNMPRAKYGPEPKPVHINNEAYLRLAGYYLAEGSIWFDRNKNNIPVRVSFSFNTMLDGEYIDETVQLLSEIAPGSKVRIDRHRETCTNVIVNSAVLARHLDRDFGHGYEEKRVPAWILNDDRASALCLRGLFRGDGCSGENGFSFSTTSHHLAHGVSLMLRRHGIPSALQFYAKRVGADGVVHRPAYDLDVRNAYYIPKLTEIVGMPNRHQMQDKQYPNVVFERDGYWYHHVQSITTEQFEGTVYNLNVADVHNYVCVGGLVSNCHPRDNIALSWLARNLGMGYDFFGDIMRTREEQTAWLASIIEAEAERLNLPVVLLGKAFKAGTNLVDGSCATLITHYLTKPFRQWDPHIDKTPWPFGGKESPPALFFIATNHPEFYETCSAPPDAGYTGSYHGYRFELPLGSAVIDPWGLMPNRDGIYVKRIGRH